MKSQYAALEPRSIEKYECPNFNETPGTRFVDAEQKLFSGKNHQK